MTLDLDKRQRAMLREMGIRVWQPAAAAAPALQPAMPAVSATIAMKSVANSALSESATGTFQAQSAPVQATRGASAETRPDPPALADVEGGPAGWSVGEALALYEDAAPGAGARWLVLAETAATALTPGRGHPLEGEAGKLLDNMLRAAKLHQAGAALFAPLVRGIAGSPAGAGLAEVLAGAKPDIVLVMGRLAAQALLQSSEPFGKLRGQIHRLHGFPTIVTHDAPYLLRNQADKAKAWDDLCLAMSLV